jgi:hypothetical protein
MGGQRLGNERIENQAMISIPLSFVKFMFWKFSADAAANFYSIREELHLRKSLIRSWNWTVERTHNFESLSLCFPLLPLNIKEYFLNDGDYYLFLITLHTTWHPFKRKIQ